MQGPSGRGRDGSRNRRLGQNGMANPEEIAGHSSGVYFATLEVGNSACSDVDTVEINVGLNDISELAASNLAIYPNPNNGLFTINFNELDYSQAKIEIINSIGQTIYVLNKVELVNEINMKENAKGIYFIKVAIEKEVFYKKINLH